MNVFELNPNQELRLQVGDDPIKLELRRGLAEVYGTEMLCNKPYTLQRNSKAAVFTYQGAVIELSGNPLKCHVGQKCDYMSCYLNIHGDLEKMRQDAENHATQTNQQDLSKTPICLVCKPMYARNVGKSSLCRILLNYAVRRGRAPIFVDLDPDQGHVGLPGSVGALSIESPIDIQTGLQLDSSMLMHYGHTNPSNSNEKGGSIFKSLLVNTATIVHSKLEQDRKSYCSGVIINTGGWSDDNGYKLLVHACKAFKTNMVLVMDDEVLQDDLKKDLSELSVRVISVPKTVGIVTRMPDHNIESRYMRIREYFYGTVQAPFSPTTTDLKFSFVKKLIYRVDNPLTLPDSLMPLGTKAQENRVKVSQYECAATDLLHHLLAISFCKIDEIAEQPDLVLKNNIMGFICITSVKSDGEVVSILAPRKHPRIVDNVLLYCDVQYMDSLI